MFLVTPADRQHVVELAPQALHRRLDHAEGRHRSPKARSPGVHRLVEIAEVNEEHGEEI